MRMLVRSLGLMAGAVFSAAAFADSPVAGLVGSGGTLSAALDGSGDAVHTFTATGASTFTAPAEVGLKVRYLVIGGGGGGGAASIPGAAGGGGGGGGWRTGSFVIPKGTSISLSVGAGGAGQAAGGASTLTLPDSTVVTAPGGGAGGTGGPGGNGANGGGGSRGGTNAGGVSNYYEDDGETARGFPGGSGDGNYKGGGGGGGAGGPGGNASGSGANGGIGKIFDITGTEVYYCGGGGGAQGIGSGAGSGGLGGGGNAGSAGAANTGGGGGGNCAGGGSGVIILRYTPCTDEVQTATVISEISSTSAKFTCTVGYLKNASETCTIKLQIGQLNGPLSEPEILGSAVAVDGSVSVTKNGLSSNTQYRYRVTTITSGEAGAVFSDTFKTTAEQGSGGFIRKLADGWFVHIFYSSGVFIAPLGGVSDLRYLIVGGGGGGGGGKANGYAGGGGGGGAVHEGHASALSQESITVTVGAGGARATKGSDSSVTFADSSSLVAPGGGAGGNGGAGGAGGNGGGGADHSSGGACNDFESDGITPHGYNGGAGYYSGYSGGGGAGAGGPGSNGGSYGGNGGPGAASDIGGTLSYYGGGGGGGQGIQSGPGTGGVGGGANGGNGVGATNTGGGGGGGTSAGSGAAGGSGIVILRYAPSGFPANVTVTTEKGPCFISARMTLASCGDGESSGDVYVAIGSDADHLGEFEKLGAGVSNGAVFERMYTGLEPDTDYLVSVKFVAAASGKVTYCGASVHTDDTPTTAVPILSNPSVYFTDVNSGAVRATGFVSWGGNANAQARLVLKYGRTSGNYKYSRVVSEAVLGTLTGDHRLLNGTWYCAVVARSECGESPVLQEFVLTSKRPHKDGLIVTFW